MDQNQRRPVLAGLLLAVALSEVVVALGAGLATGRGWNYLLDHFVVTNVLIGASLALAGWPIAWQRPRNRIGWLLLGGGICYAGSGTAFALLAWGSHPGDERPFWRWVGTWANASWPWAIVGFLPLALLLFPDGRFIYRPWRWLLLPTVVGTLLFVGSALFGADNLAADLGVRSYLIWPGFEQMAWLGVLSEVCTNVVLAAAALSLVLRFMRGDEQTRRQLLWLLLAVGVMIVGFTVPDLLHIQTRVSLFAICLVPLSIMIAILRYQLLDIRLVVSRFALYLVLSGLVVAGYLGLVALLDRVAGQPEEVDRSVIVVLALAAAFHPVRVWLQRRVDRLFYGSRHNPMRALAEVGSHLGELEADTTGLQGALRALCVSLRLPAAEIRAGGVTLASVGSVPPGSQVTELRRGSETIGELVTAQRRGEHRVAAADQRILGLVGILLAVAVQATLLAGELQESRSGVLAAREEERTRVRRDLHDGLGPRLTGVMLKAGAARRFAGSAPDRSTELLSELEDDTASAIADIRRLVYDLRPPALDGLGLVGALREYANSIRPADSSGLRLSLHASPAIEPLPAVVELAAYRIATESLTNVIRHARASSATLSIDVQDGVLRMSIDDDGDSTRPWSAGVGLSSMDERATQLGGTVSAGPGVSGGHVAVAIPLGTR